MAEPAVRVVIRFSPDWASYVDEREWHASQTTRRLDDGRLVWRPDEDL